MNNFPLATNNNASEADHNYSYYDHDNIVNETKHYQHYPETLISNNGVLELCNYFNTTQNWNNFLISTLFFFYLVLVFIMSASYGLIIKKVSYVK